MEAALWDIVVVGGVNTDYLGHGPALPAPGLPVEGDTFQVGPGGKGANQAVGATRLGTRVALIARVGADDRGAEAIAALDAEGVDTGHVERDQTAPTGVVLLHVGGDGEKQSLAVSGANRRFGIADVRGAAATIGRTRTLLATLEAPLEVVAEAVQLARQGGARVVLDPGPPVPLPDDLLRSADVIKPNRYEAAVLTGILPTDSATAREAATRLLARGVGAVAIQVGGGDNLIVWRDGERWLPALPVERVDTTGAGDAFAAALAVAVAEEWTLAEAGRFASAAAALATTAIGAQAGLPDRAAVMALLARWGGM